MKTFTQATKNPGAKALLLSALCLTGALSSLAQLPDCLTGNVMYGVFTPTAPAVNADSTEIRSINYTTGAVGGLMGGKRYYIVRNFGGSNFYGSSAMAMSCVTSRFYLFTQMGTGNSTKGAKDIIAINPLLPTPTMTVIGTTPSSVDNYHIVKAAISPNGWGYAIGVHRTSTSATNVFNPLYRFKVCNTAGCANGAGNWDLLGYLADTGVAQGMNMFNGDIAFDATGNLYFMAAGYNTTLGRYADSRLFRIASGNIPGSAGTGTIPISFLGDFNALDSTGGSGIALDPSGNIYISVRRYTNNDPTQPYNTELYRAYSYTSVGQLTGFVPPANTSVGDLASGYFSATILAKNEVNLSASKAGMKANLNWKVYNNTEVTGFEVQRSADGINFETIASISPSNTQSSDASYYFADESAGNEKFRYYRIRQSLTGGAMRFYSNVAKISWANNVSMSGKFSPNPFVDRFDINAELGTGSSVQISLLDLNGKILRQEQFAAHAGSNKFTLNGMGSLNKGVYIVELRSGAEVIREKISKL